jgi:FKBP-type peptidyl-prolyl cis-trans isomerase 2
MKKIALLILCTGLVILLGAQQLKAEGEGMSIQDGRKVSFDYTLTVEGEVFETTKGKEPLEYIHGQGQIIPGLERELAGLVVGEEKAVTVTPDEAYGQVDPEAFQEIPKSSLPEDLVPEVGMVLAMRTPQGQSIPVRISQVNEDSVVLDLNHPLAGKTLNFKVKIVSIE